MTETPFERPPLRIDLGGGTEIKMTYGLEMDLRRLLPNAEATLQLVMHDPTTQDYIVRRCLTPGGKLVKDLNDLIPANEVMLDSDDVEKLLMWVTEHVLYFFVKRAQSMSTLGARYETAVPTTSTPSASGSETSPSMTPSAGPTE